MRLIMGVEGFASLAVGEPASRTGRAPPNLRKG